MNEQTLSLRRMSGHLSRNGFREMNGRSSGIRIREEIEKALGGREQPLRVVLDFTGTGPIDFSWADEVVAKLVSRLWGGEYGEKFLVLKGLNPSQAENIGVALERKKLAVLSCAPEEWRILGSLNNYLAHTLNRVMKRKQLTLRQLSEEQKIGMNTSGTRLLNLYKKHLVSRVERPMGSVKEVPHRGRQYIYQSLLG